MNLETYAIYKMIWETCGEDPDVLENAKIVKIADDGTYGNHYHITYKEKDQFEGIDLKVRVHILPREKYSSHKIVCQYEVYSSVYGDDGAFEIEL